MAFFILSTLVYNANLVMFVHPQGCHEIRSTKVKDNSRMFQGYFHDFQGCHNVEEMPRCGADIKN